MDDRSIQAQLAELKKGHSGWSNLDTKGKTAYIWRALARSHKRRYMVANVEGYNGYTKRSNDLYGLWDLLVITPSQTIGVQATGGDWAAHLRLYKGDRSAAMALWLACPSRRAECWGWTRKKSYKKDGTRGVRRVVTPKVAVLDLEWLHGEDGPMMINPFEVRD